MSMISVTPLSAPAASGQLFVLFLVKQEVLVSLGKKSKTFKLDPLQYSAR